MHLIEDIINNDELLHIQIMEIEPSDISKNMKNLYKHSKLFGYRIYELYNDDNKFICYAIRSIDLKTHFNNVIKNQNSIEAYYNDESESCTIIDDNFFSQIYKSNILSSKTIILLLCLFEDDEVIIKRCRSKIGFYMVAKISINLVDKCVISPEHNITGYRIDNMFIIKSFDDYIPNICLEIDEDGHNDRNREEEIARENFIKSFNHKMIRVSVKRSETDYNIDELIKKTTKDIQLMIDDLLVEYSIDSISESDFINKITNEVTINKEFARMFVRKNDDKFDHFKYKHSEIAQFLGYEDVENYKHFIALMRKELKQDIDYIITNSDAINSTVDRRVSVTSKRGRGNKNIYYISRVGFYMLCMMANKPNAKLYRRQFGELYEFTIKYVNSLRQKIISGIQSPDVSEKAVTNRLEYKTESIIKNKSISKLEVENNNLKKEIENLRLENMIIQKEKDRFKTEAEFYMNKSLNNTKTIKLRKIPNISKLLNQINLEVYFGYHLIHYINKKFDFFYN